MSLMSPENPPEAREAPAPVALAAPPSGPVRYEPLNLSRRPFLNSRPVVRASLLLWVLGLLLLLGNVSLFWNYLSVSEDQRAEVVRGVEAIQRREAEARQLESRLDSINLEDLNERIRFLNTKIAERTFSWNLLLDHLAQVLPNDVRLNRLNPATGEQVRRSGQGSRSASRGPAREGQVTLEILGETRSDEALDRFVDNLYDHPTFEYPNLTRQEQLQESGIVRFEMIVQYVPGRGLQTPNVVIEEMPATPGAAPAPAPGGRP